MPPEYKYPVFASSLIVGAGIFLFFLSLLKSWGSGADACRSLAFVSCSRYPCPRCCSSTLSLIKLDYLLLVRTFDTCKGAMSISQRRVPALPLSVLLFCTSPAWLGSTRHAARRKERRQQGQRAPRIRHSSQIALHGNPGPILSPSSQPCHHDPRFTAFPLR